LIRQLPGELYLVTDRHRTGGRPLLSVVEAALRGGVRAVQLREKDLSTRELLALAEPLRRMTRLAGAALIINDRVDVCLTVGADGVHLRSDHLPIPFVRECLGRKRLIGVSCHSLEEVAEAERKGADFSVLGPVLDTPSKRPFGAPIGKEVLERAASSFRLPVYAIGGIRADRIEDIMDTGVRGVAVVSALLEAQNVEEAAREMTAILRARPSKSIAIDRMASR
jgi:thiamine-phosphate pyrophosphorylase